MILQLANQKDKLAMLQVLGWDESIDFSVTPLLANILSDHVPKEEEVAEVVIAKKMVPYSYRGNPSLLAKVILPRADGFLSSSGCEMPDTNFIKVAFYREKKPIRKFSHKFSVKGAVREWLESKVDGEPLPALTIDIKDITPAYLARPEQLTYAVKREMGEKIRLRRMKTKWVIVHEEAQ